MRWRKRASEELWKRPKVFISNRSGLCDDQMLKERGGGVPDLLEINYVSYDKRIEENKRFWKEVLERPTDCKSL